MSTSYSDKFYGQQEDERILYVTFHHPLALWISLAKVGAAALLLLVAFGIIGSQIPFGGVAVGLGVGLSLVTLLIGTLSVLVMEQKNVGYITDRRVVRFMATTPLTQSSRSLSWDEAVKVKTYQPNPLLKLMNVGRVVVHAKSTVLSTDVPKTESVVSEDDVMLDYVYYYKDLGNYIDKILHLYRQKPKELERLRAFVPKPRGKRG